MLDCFFFSRDKSKDEEIIHQTYSKKDIKIIKNKIDKYDKKSRKECCLCIAYSLSSITSIIGTFASGGTSSPATVTSSVVCSTAAGISFDNWYYYSNKKKVLKELLLSFNF
tara:strand:- start:275 stop:607 length:333 start_codon:yes stop_codon:yes gene_type:complete